jgi:hypothetical protein
MNELGQEPVRRLLGTKLGQQAFGFDRRGEAFQPEPTFKGQASAVLLLLHSGHERDVRAPNR